MITLKGSLLRYAQENGYETHFQIPEQVRVYPGTDEIQRPSVTSILGILPTPQGILDWQERIGMASAKRISTEAMLRGTEFHKYCENYWTKGNKPVVIDRLCKKMINGFLTWVTKEKKKIELIKHKGKPLIEFKIRNSKLGYAGTIDLPCVHSGIMSIEDYKTASSAVFYPESIHKYSLQNAAYIALWNDWCLKHKAFGREWFALEGRILNFTYSRKTGIGEHVFLRQPEITRLWHEFMFYKLIFDKIYARYRSQIANTYN